MHYNTTIVCTKQQHGATPKHKLRLILDNITNYAAPVFLAISHLIMSPEECQKPHHGVTSKNINADRA
jgi:surface polysaccharide O-acyltransferase-like enzyme